jgi:putative FmdB family regulatory protein
MPIYEYQCGSCAETFEAIRKFSDAPLDTCRKCGASGNVRKLLSAPAFRLKGSGWYETDFKKGDKRNVARGDSDSGSSSGSSSSGTEGGSSSGKEGGKKGDGGSASGGGDGKAKGGSGSASAA